MRCSLQLLRELAPIPLKLGIIRCMITRFTLFVSATKSFNVGPESHRIGWTLIFHDDYPSLKSIVVSTCPLSYNGWTSRILFLVDTHSGYHSFGVINIASSPHASFLT